MDWTTGQDEWPGSLVSSVQDTLRESREFDSHQRLRDSDLWQYMEYLVSVAQFIHTYVIGHYNPLVGITA